MGNRSGELPHRGDAICVREFHQGFTVAPLVFAAFGFRPLERRQIKDEADAIIRTSPNMVPPISTGTRLPSFRTYSFSNG